MRKITKQSPSWEVQGRPRADGERERLVIRVDGPVLGIKRRGERSMRLLTWDRIYQLACEIDAAAKKSARAHQRAVRRGALV
jgi:hypothetical protein